MWKRTGFESSRVLLSPGLNGCAIYFIDEWTSDVVESRIDMIALFKHAHADLAAKEYDA